MTMAGRVTPSGGIPLAGDVGPAEAGVQMTGGLASGGIAEMGGVPGGQVEQGGMPNTMGGMGAGQPAPPRVLGPVISEVQLSSPNALNDADGDSPRWLELFNPHDAPIGLNGLVLVQKVSDQERPPDLTTKYESRSF